MSQKELSDIRRKLRILNYGKEIKNVSKACRHFGISREIYYQWKRAYAKRGENALINLKPCPQNPKIRVPESVEDFILHLRTTYHHGRLRTSWYLKRYHGIKVS
jgi:transposase